MADWFVSAVELIHTRKSVAWVSLVAHLCRDLMNRTPRIADVLVDVDGKRDEKARRVEYADLVEKASAALADDLDGEIALTPEATDALRRLVVAHRALNLRVAQPQRRANPGESETARREFDRQWRATQRFFQRLTHLPAKGVSDVSSVEVERRFSILEDLLVTRLRAVPYWTLDEELRKIAELEAPTVEDLRRAMVWWRGDAETLFFEQLSSAAWVPLIVTSGFLERLRGVETSGEGARLPFWPVSRYLARVAGDAPTVVLAAIERLGPTENGRVHDDLVKALLAMPPATAARAVDQVLGWLGQRWGRFAAESAALLAARLAAGGEPGALTLAKRLASIRVRADERDVGLGPRVRYDTVFHSDYEYDNALAELLPVLVAAHPVATATMLAACQERFGKLADPDIANPIRVGWGQPSSRYSAADLRAMPTDVLVHTIKTYTPDTNVFPPEMDNGLAVVLGAAVGEDPNYWTPVLVSIASELPDDDYLVAALDALSTPRDADGEGWDAALALCEHVLQRTSADEHRRLAHAAGHVVEAVVRSGSDPQAELSAQLMRLLRLLLADPDPGPDTDASSAERPVHGALNAVRARALGTFISLALRLHPKARAIAHPSLTHMPDVLELLEAHLDPENEPSPLVRSEYGAQLGNLFYLDRPWTTAHLPDIFDSDRPALAEAAWRGYVVRSYITTYVLSPVIATDLYASYLAVLQDTPPADEDQEAEQLRTRLIDHVAYAWVFDVPGASDLLGIVQQTADVNREAFIRNLAFGLLREGMTTSCKARSRACWSTGANASTSCPEPASSLPPSAGGTRRAGFLSQRRPRSSSVPSRRRAVC